MPHDLSEEVAAAIHRIRTEKGLTLGQLGEKCGLSRDVVGYIESGRPKDGVRTRDIAIDELQAIAAALEVPPAHLLPVAWGLMTPSLLHVSEDIKRVLGQRYAQLRILDEAEIEAKRRVRRYETEGSVIAQMRDIVAADIQRQQEEQQILGYFSGPPGLIADNED